MVRSTVSGNEAARGGGIRNAGGRLYLDNSTISGNRAQGSGGGIHNFGYAQIIYSTVTANAAHTSPGIAETTLGGGVYNAPEFDDGVPSTVVIISSIIAGNADNRSRFLPEFSPDCFSADPGRFISFRNNVVGILNGNCNVKDFELGDPRYDQAGSNEAPLDPQLLALSDNGGPTATHALIWRSPAIDRGNRFPPYYCSGASFRVDQRGLSRPSEGPELCDSGSFEFGAPRPVCAGLLATIWGTDENDALTGTAAGDVIHGRGGDDVIRGFGAADTICGGSGNDILFGQGGGDSLFGGSGADRLVGGPGPDACDGGPGADTVENCER